MDDISIYVKGGGDTEDDIETLTMDDISIYVEGGGETEDDIETLTVDMSKAGVTQKMT